MEKRIKKIVMLSWVFASLPLVFVFFFFEKQTLWWTLIGIFSFISCIVFCGLYDQTSFDSIPKFKFYFSGRKVVMNAIPLMLLSILVCVPFLFVMILNEKTASIGSGFALISFLLSSFKIFSVKIIRK